MDNELIITEHLSRCRQYGKRANLKTGVTRKQSTSNFAKKRTFLPPMIHVRKFAYQVVRNVRFPEIWRALLSLRLERVPCGKICL